MAKKKRQKPIQKQEQKPAEVKNPVPKFEIGQKGDEFDIKYTRAASSSKSKADALLRSLSKESRTAGYNLINFAVLSLLIIVFSMSFAFLSRKGDAPQMRIKSLADGSYTACLGEYYRETLPFGQGLKSAWAFLGFTDMPESIKEIPDDPIDDPVEDPTDDPIEPAVTTEPTVTTAPTTTDAPTSAPVTEPTEATVPETKTMYVRDTVNIRLQPSSDSMIMGYFEVNEEVEVIELRSDGWAEILYNGISAYISSDYLGEETVATTKATRRTTTETTTEETTEEVTTVPEEMTDEITTVPDETSAETTTKRTMDPELSNYIERQSILESKRQAAATQETDPAPEPDPADSTEPTDSTGEP